MHVHPGIDSVTTQTLVHLLRKLLCVPLVRQHHVLPHGYWLYYCTEYQELALSKGKLLSIVNLIL